MTDPFSVAAGVAGLVSLGIEVTQSLVDFYNAYKKRDSDLVGMIERLESLLDIFQCLEKTLLDRNFQADEQGLIKRIETLIKNCDELIQELRDECQKFSKASSNGIKAAVRVAGHRAIYPFRQSTLQKLDEDIGEIRANLSSALDVLQLKDTKRIQDDITETKVLWDLVRTSQISSILRDWLNAPDATIDHNTACAKKHPGTGTWLVDSPQFSRWLTEGNSTLWLNGFAGSGKSVLCSTAINFTLRRRRSDPNVGIAFFYFTFNDKWKQDVSAMLRALLLQLSSQLQDGHTDLTRLHDSYKAGTPPSPVLIEYLRRLIQRFHQVYIMMDALDESPRNTAREDVLDAIETMRKWSLQGLHLFVTSRDEPDICDSLDLSATQQVIMQNAGINKDIADFISGRFDTDRKLRELLPYHDNIQEALSKRAKGVFRWVECQFKSLRSCPRSEDHLEGLLNSLPQSLDETYERMLCNIDHYLIEDARRILTLLCFAPRPLTVREVIDGVAVKLNNSPGLNRKRRLQDSNDIREICIGFIDIGLGADYTTETYHEEELTPTVRIAHFSVQEYLESERILHQKAAIFSLTSVTAHAEIAQICLIYLLEHDLSSSNLDQGLLKEFPLAQFAARYWYHHYQNAVNCAPGMDDFILKLFQRQDSFVTWVKLHDMDRPWTTSIDFSRVLDNIAAPVYYASLLGLDQALHQLINSEQLESTPIPALSPASTSKVSKKVNTQGGHFGNALQAALQGGHYRIVQTLLDEGADINAQGGFYGNALQAASYGGYDKVVQILLDKGADINAQGGFYGNALQAASYGGYDKVVQILLDKGADINTQGGEYSNALQAASDGGHDKVVQTLLDKGADINAQGREYGNALQAASYGGHDKVVQTLLDKGADINAQGGFYSNALQAASDGGHDKVVQTLLDKGADINAQGGFFGTALQAASYGGHDKVVQTLLDKGADINAQGGGYGNALQAASDGGHDKVVQTLLDKGADINAQGGFFGNALQAASYRGHDKVVRLLLNHDTVVDRKDIQGRTPFHLACAGGWMKTVEMLSSFGSDSTVIDTQGRNCLHHAASKGSIETVKWLLKEGFDPNDADRDGWTSLHWAAKNGSVGTIEVLKAAGASSTIEVIEGWTPDSVAIFHHNKPSSISHENAKSELAAKRNISSSAAAVESMGDECKVSPGIWQNGYYCNGCLLVSFNLNKLLNFFI
ncbi:hypothetical protein OEA41_006754 [Lepraria neglecta]|uniref:NACHT domain-containing protein n=1 Tax=Lepraria neglecta TaxID=209136 RepID=A0AAE0DL75_9LECA|nr:hypothetical protein OEA41_006754 [Lepraria neglecta]